MREPQAYFSSAFESELAAEAWKVGGNTNVDMFFTWYPPHPTLSAAVETAFQKRVIAARNWITAMRDQNGPWGDTGIDRVKTYYKQVYGRDVTPTNTAIANVEHFYTSAMITVISGAFYALPTALIISYEVHLQPILVGLTTLSARRAWGNFVNGWKQLAGPDRAGVQFVLMNSNFSALDVQQFLSVEPEILEAAALPPRNRPAQPPVATAPTAPAAGTKTTQLKPGQCLSLVAKDLYKSVELWPLLWDMNKMQIPNPNRVAVGTVLKYKDLNEYTQLEVADAKRRSPTWKNYPQ
ncbi:MAG: hypothetical protein PSX37_04915 [bacterium]|nr:hypothetical protein [bacterium]